MEDDKVKKSHAIGVELANAAKDYEKAEYVGDPGVCPHCHNRNFYLNDDATKAICCACPAECRWNGQRNVDDDYQVKFIFLW